MGSIIAEGIESITSLVAALQKCSTNREMGGILQNINLKDWDLDVLAQWSESQYQRVYLHQQETFELMLICWESCQFSGIHNHGGGDCWVHVVTGSLYEERFKTVNGCPVLTDSKLYKSNSCSHINDKKALHRLGNNGPSRAMSLHLYASPIKHYQEWNGTTDTFITKKCE